MKYNAALETVQKGHRRFQQLISMSTSDLTTEDKAFLKEYDNYSPEDWVELVENAESKCQSALAQFTQVDN